MSDAERTPTKERHDMRTICSCIQCREKGFQCAMENAAKCDNCMGFLIELAITFWKRAVIKSEAHK